MKNFMSFKIDLSIEDGSKTYLEVLDRGTHGI